VLREDDRIIFDRIILDLENAFFLNPKTDIEPRITRIETDYEEVLEMIPKLVWCILKSVKSV